MENQNNMNLERKVSFLKSLGYMGLYLGKAYTPYFGDKMIHNLANESRKQIKKGDLGLPKCFINSSEVAFYGAKYFAFYGIAKSFF